MRLIRGTVAVSGAVLLLVSLSVVTATQAAAASVPGAPTWGTVLETRDGRAGVYWAPPASDGGSPITVYVVTAYVGYAPVLSVLAGPAKRDRVLSGLTYGTTYRFRVRAYNAVGAGSFSTASKPLVLGPLPGPPTNVHLIDQGPCTATATGVPYPGEIVDVGWEPPVTGAPATGYHAALSAVSSVGYGLSWVPTLGFGATKLGISYCLPNGTLVGFSIAAFDGFGDGPGVAIQECLGGTACPVPV